MDLLAKALKVGACHADIGSLVLPDVCLRISANFRMASGHVRLLD
jgi:hypothetical protein